MGSNEDEQQCSQLNTSGNIMQIKHFFALPITRDIYFHKEM